MSAKNHVEPAALNSFEFPDKSKNIFVVVTIVGLIILGLGMTRDAGRAYYAYLMNLFFFMCLTIGGIVFCATQHVTNAGWSATVRRIAESFWAFFGVIIIGSGVLLVIRHGIFEWTHLDVVSGDKLLIAKHGYLNTKFFALRMAFIFGLWAVFGYTIRGKSLKQDTDSNVNHTLQNSRISAAFLPLFALSFSFVCFDWVMSLQPHFYSTMFAVYCFAGMFMATLAMMICVAYYLWDRGYVRGWINENHFHDLGKLMFAMIVFWAYVGFSQFMLIWYANLPEENFYYLDRAKGGWLGVSYALLIAKFIIPFLVLLPRKAKRNPRYLRNIAVWVLGTQLLDVYWMVMPSYLKEGPQFPWVELGGFAFFLGLFVLVITRFFATHGYMAKNDPRLYEALHLHQ